MLLLPLELLPDDISDPELDVAVFVTEILADPELLNPVFESEDPILMPVDVVAVGNEDPETASKEFAIDDPVETPTVVLAVNIVDPE